MVVVTMTKIMLIGRHSGGIHAMGLHTELKAIMQGGLCVPQFTFLLLWCFFAICCLSHEGPPSPMKGLPLPGRAPSPGLQSSSKQGLACHSQALLFRWRFIANLDFKLFPQS